MKLILTAAMPLFAVACAPLPELDVSSSFSSPADASSPVSSMETGPSVTYRHRPVEEPGDWTVMNDEQIGDVE